MPDSSSGLFSLLHLSVYRPEMKPLRFHFGFLPRKEVIQPQVLLRLPCYDFTPIADPTLGRCPAYALAHELWVLPTLMV